MAMNLVARKYPKQLLIVCFTDCDRIGAFGVTFGLPILVYLFAFLCNDISGCPVPSALSPKSLTLEQLKLETGWPEEGIMGLFDVEVLGYVLAYYASSLLLQIILPGNVVEGTKLRSGGTLKYKMNGMLNPLLIPRARREAVLSST